MRIKTNLSAVTSRVHHPKKLWLVKEAERVIVEVSVPPQPTFGPNVFYDLRDVFRYCERCTLDWIKLALIDIEDLRADPIRDPEYWEKLARLEYLHEHGWPMIQEVGSNGF